jgi:polysaccharide export outer membrane protein
MSTFSKCSLAVSLGIILGGPILGNAQSSGAPHLVTRNRYTIEAGDKIEIAFRYTPELNQSVTVQPDGYVTLEPAGEIKVSGLTIGEATDLIIQKSSVHLKDPRVTLELKEFHKPFFVVAGEVAHPGRFDMDQPTTALQAVLEAGGIAAAGRSSQVIVFRRISEENDEVHLLDLHKMKTQRDLEHDMMLEPGDMILVPRDRIAKIDRVIRVANASVFFNPTSF